MIALGPTSNLNQKICARMLGKNSEKSWRSRWDQAQKIPQVVRYLLSLVPVQLSTFFWVSSKLSCTNFLIQIWSCFFRNRCRRPQNSFNGMVVVSGHLQPASGSTRTFLWLWMGGWSDKWHTQVLQHDYDEGVGERVGWENVPKIHQKLLKMAPISSDVVRRTCV